MNAKVAKPNIAGDGGALAALLAVSYYPITLLLFCVLRFRTLILKTPKEFFDLVVTLIGAGLLVAVPICFAAMTVGSLTGAWLPKLLKAAGAKHSWQAGIVGFTFSTILVVPLLRLLTAETELIVLFVVGTPALIFVVSATYLATQFLGNKDAIGNLITKLTTRPMVFWLPLIPLVFNAASLLLFFIGTGALPKLGGF